MFEAEAFLTPLQQEMMCQLSAFLQVPGSLKMLRRIHLGKSRQQIQHSPSDAALIMMTDSVFNG